MRNDDESDSEPSSPSGTCDPAPARPARAPGERIALPARSHFLLGPRQTGKTFLINRSLQGVRLYDLLDTTIFLALSRDPTRLGQELRSTDKLVFIDEIQRMPELLNEVHRLIETIRFLLTGSSARKLRRGGVNLLGGRTRTRPLHPLTRRELGPHLAARSGRPAAAASRQRRGAMSGAHPGSSHREDGSRA
ncbi:MAG: AAA family ATPase [Planctomycetota bacterium]